MAVQGRMGRTAALRSGSQDELPRSPNLWNFAFSDFSVKFASMEYSQIRVRQESYSRLYEP
jgi:hypothetical protein